MPEPKLFQVAAAYNAMLADFVAQHNQHHLIGSATHIYNLAEHDDYHALRSKGYKVSVLPLPQICAESLVYPDSIYQAFIEDAILDGSRAHLFPHAINEVSSHEMTTALKESVTLSVIVEGNGRECHSFEYHIFGKEFVLPRLFDALMLVARGYDFSTEHIEVAGARILYMPNTASSQKMYCIEKAAHAGPFVLGLIEVYNAPHTGDSNLDTHEESINREKQCAVFHSRNTVVAYARTAPDSRLPKGSKGNVPRLVGETDAPIVIAKVQHMTDEKIRPMLEQVLGEK